MRNVVFFVFFQDDLTIDPMPLEGKSRKDRSSFYAAYTDLACYDYRPLISSDVNPVKKHLIFLNTYRLHSPFPVYLSILQSNGPQCYEEIDQSSCATSKLVLPFYPRLLSIILILSIIAIGLLLHRRRTISSSSSSSTTETIRKPIDETLEKQFRQWFDQHDHVEHLRQACREALNHVLTKTDVSDDRHANASSYRLDLFSLCRFFFRPTIFFPSATTLTVSQS